MAAEQLLPSGRRRANELRVEGNALFSQKRMEEALQRYEQALELCPDHLVYRLNKAAALLELGQHQEVRSKAFIGHEPEKRPTALGPPLRP